jgi:glycosyltransferase involved in cell wall biosynthesis
MIPLSAVIITLNEEEKIGICLDSLKGIADEIVVVDSFSTDGTEGLCLARGVRFLRHRFQGYVEQIRHAVDQAAFPHVLSIDADEALSPRLRESILAVKKEFPNDAYCFNRLNYFCGIPIRHGAWHPDRKLRLWRKDRGGYGGANPHYRVIMAPGSTTGFLEGDLLHYSYDSREALFHQSAKFAMIAAQELHRAGKRVTLPGLIFRPAFRFLRDYLLKGGMLDGFPGLLIAASAAAGNFQKHARLRQLNAAADPPGPRPGGPA